MLTISRLNKGPKYKESATDNLSVITLANVVGNLNEEHIIKDMLVDTRTRHNIPGYKYFNKYTIDTDYFEDNTISYTYTQSMYLTLENDSYCNIDIHLDTNSYYSDTLEQNITLTAESFASTPLDININNQIAEKVYNENKITVPYNKTRRNGVQISLTDPYSILDYSNVYIDNITAVKEEKLLTEEGDIFVSSYYVGENLINHFNNIEKLDETVETLFDKTKTDYEQDSPEYVLSQINGRPTAYVDDISTCLSDLVNKFYNTSSDYYKTKIEINYDLIEK